MASSEATVKLPSIENLKVTIQNGATNKGQEKATVSQQLNRAATFMSRLRLGSLQTQRRPGDVWGGGTPRQPRPLGLVPDRQSKLDIIQELRRFLPPLTSYTIPPIRASHASDVRVEQDQSPNYTAYSKAEVISATETQGQSADTISQSPLIRLSEAPPPNSLLGGNDCPILYRHPHDGHSNQANREEPDQDYMEGLDLHKYSPEPQSLPHSQAKHITAESWSGPLQTLRSKGSARLGRCRSVSSGPQFLTFSEQSQLWNRTLTDDRRLPLPLEPCERCRERGGRCARCKALRVGGGYIILDGGSLSDDQLRKRLGRRYGFGIDQGWKVGDGSGSHGNRRRRLSGDESGGGVRGGGAGDDSDSHGVVNKGGRGGLGMTDRHDRDYDSGRGSGGGGGILSSGSGRDQFRGKSGRHGDGGGMSDGATGEKTARSGDVYDDLTDGGRRGGSDGRDREGYSEDHSGRASSRGIGTGSRPGSTVGSRPLSSLKRGGLDRRSRDKKSVDLEGGHGRGRGQRKGGKEEGNVSDDSDNEGRGRRRKKRVAAAGGEGTSGDEDDEFDRAKLKFKGTREQEDDRPMSGYRGNLMRFKRKKDDVKAKHATLQELQGIDPLDYLTKYCIIDQSKLPHYQHCYDNVDRDEDDEIDLAELDFALKAVNYELISDAEMSYVHSVLELAGRYKLNFRLFSLIAALSEKVVALEDMVKRLINKMDFEALEVKMKKCKELFYLLADAESSKSADGGVVTTGSLAVELQAGGLTSDHVEFVVDRLNHEEKGLVEFLDYLTYVPLFVEIHDSIYGNPLDFSRTK